MITADLVSPVLAGHPYSFPPMTRPQGEAYVARRGGAEKGWSLVDVPSCPCCGEPAWPNGRCTKHQGRTPCVADGCARTSKLHVSYFVCGVHWRAYVPPGSPERRALNRLTRLAKRLGYSKTERWPDHLERRWWVLWDGIARRVRRRSQAGHLDQREIERLFGWDEG